MSFYLIMQKKSVEYFSNMSMKTILMNTENNKTNELHKFVLKLSIETKNSK